MIKQAIVIEKTPDEPTPEPETTSTENPPERVVPTEQPIAPTDATDQNEKKDDKTIEQPAEPPKNIRIELKPTSACKTIDSFENLRYVFVFL